MPRTVMGVIHGIILCVDRAGMIVREPRLAYQSATVGTGGRRERLSMVMMVGTLSGVVRRDPCLHPVSGKALT